MKLVKVWHYRDDDEYRQFSDNLKRSEGEVETEEFYHERTMEGDLQRRINEFITENNYELISIEKFEKTNTLYHEWIEGVIVYDNNE